MLISTREVAQAQDHLVEAIADLDDEAMGADTRCPGWTRGHVLSHIARNAEGMANLSRWALDGDVVAMYAQGRRDADIDEGAERPAAAIIDDVVATNQVALAALGELEGAVATDPMVAERVVRLGSDPETGTNVPARRLPFVRLQEVVVHHHDLRVGLEPGDWLEAYVEAGLPAAWATMAGRLDDPPTVRRLGSSGISELEPAGGTVEVTGDSGDLLVWLLGRSEPDERARLVVSPEGADLPELPDW